MNRNISDYRFGLLIGVLFGHWFALCFLDVFFHPDSDARRWIGSAGLIAAMMVFQVRSWRLRSRERAASTQ